MNEYIYKKYLKLSKSQIFVLFCLLIISISYLYFGIIRLVFGTLGLPQIIDNSMRFYAGGNIAVGLFAMWTAFTIKTQNIMILFFCFYDWYWAFSIHPCCWNL